MYIKKDSDFQIINLPVCNIQSLRIKIQVSNKTYFVTTVCNRIDKINFIDR
jgi:hypothetical protein